MWAPSFALVRNVQLFTLGLASSSILLFVASFTLGGGAGIQYPMIVTTVAVIVFVYLKNGIALGRQRNLQIIILCLSFFNAAVFLFYAARLITLAQTEDSVVSYLVGGFDVALAIFLSIDGVLTELYSQHLNRKRATSSRNTSVDAIGNTHGTGGALQAPLPVHLYQPRLSLTPEERMSIHSGVTAPTGDDTETAQQQQQDNDAMEFEELPKYQRRRPAQHATIVDMANHDGSGLEQGQELRLELGGDLSTVEAPEYSPSPSLVGAPAETLEAPLAIPAPTDGLLSSTQSATSTHSGSSSVVLTMPLSEAPAAPPAAAPTDTPSVTITSAPPIYVP
ncbi:hypothetical protein KVV02_003817 [Mortierella alpina]|uniref:Uncharacterized protein n=1 Tax=Mortierella alpina TaxID=64518 RepID=A0A9P8IFQ4_MORAP|nr:hypothetical protein KVV02_003817 [Mortierella alpina]